MENALSAGAIAVIFSNSVDTPVASPGCLPEQLHFTDEAFTTGTLLPSVIIGYAAGK
jgi:hypothetical protein